MEPWEQISIPEIQEKSHKKRNGLIIASVAAGCILAVLLSGIFLFRIYNTAERRILRGFQRLAGEVIEQQVLLNKTGEDTAKPGAMKLETTLNLSSEELPITLGVDTVLLRDTDARRMRADTALSVMNRKLVQIQTYGEEETLTFRLPDFFDQNLAFDTRRIDSQYNQSLFAEKFGEVDMPETSLQLFPEQEWSGEKLQKVWKNFLEDWKESLKSEDTLPEIQVEMVEEEIEVNIPGNSDRQYLCSQYLVTIPKEWSRRLALDEAKVRLEQDIALLVAMDRHSRIICLSLKKPLSLMVETENGEKLVELEADISFLGEERSIDDMIIGVGLEIPVTYPGAERSWRGLLPGRGNAAVKEHRVALRAETELVFTENNMCIVMEPNQITAVLDDEDLFKVTGRVVWEPLREGIEPLEGETIRLFEITEAQYEDLERQLSRKLRKWAAALGDAFL
ncbi:MAG: hypothetical protein NC318_07810 [Blautia sp.]|nr:hypothetical protein [Lachnoclostridium sp.]MCM1211494.1 hypothetical protein [Blautia sp.]